MDRKENNEANEAKERRREELLARRLAQALDERRPPGANDCPGAEMIAAYADQALDPSELARCENHFAGCARCRTILRVITASADTPLAEKEVAHLGELVTGARVPAQIAPTSLRPQRPRHIDWRLRWLAPALGVAAAVAVLLVLKAPQRAIQHSNSETLVAQTPKQELPLPPSVSEGDRASRIAPFDVEKQKEKKSSSNDSSSSLDAVAPNSSVEALAKRETEDQARSKGTTPQPDQEFTRMQRMGRVQPTSPLPVIPSAPPAAAQPSPQLQADTAPNSSAPAPQLGSDANAVGGLGSRDKQAVMAQSEAVQQSGAAPAKKAAAAEATLNEQKPQAFALARPMQKDETVLKAALGNTVWRGGRGGKIERSVDGGKTWLTQASPSLEDWLAGAAVSDAVCWLVGRHGAIGRTTDGEHWEIVSSPAAATAPNGAPPDWVSVTALDAQTATITAADGRKFATIDAGKSWLSQ